MKPFAFALLAATALGAAAFTQQTVVASSGKPTFGTFGMDEAGMDKTVAPGDSFYNYANGNWAKTTPIPSDKSNYGAFNLLADLSESRTRGILEKAAVDPNSKIGTAYATYLDTGSIEAKGLTPIKP
ncbi:MAG: M13 family peptidase, partial [Sphingomonas sp.]|nr:M13 family peptidase [Sphingomonas sp.]